MPRCASLPSQLFKPPSISRSECARPNWQNIMATNWLQLDSPFEAYSDLVCLTIRSKSMRGINLSIWLNMLHDALTVGLLWGGSDEFRRSPAPYTVGWPIVISRLGQ